MLQSKYIKTKVKIINSLENKLCSVINNPFPTKGYTAKLVSAKSKGDLKANIL